MSAIAITDDLFFNRAGLDRGKSERTVGEALKGGDDGELFLEYDQSESLSFDDGKLKSASFDTTQGFGLRAVAGEAHGYAHAGDLVGRGAAARRRHGEGGAMPATAARWRSRRAAPTGCSMPTTIRSAAMDSRAKVALLAGDRRLCPRQGPARQAGDGLDLAATGRWCRSSAPTAAAPPTSGRWCGSTSASWCGEGGRMETGSHGTGGRVAYERYLDAGALEGAGRRGAAPGAGQPRLGRRRRPARCTVVLGAGWPGVLLHEAIGHGLEGDFNRKKTSAFAGLMGERVASPGRHRGRRRHAARPPRLAHHRRRGHADPAHRADRGRHPGRLHAGPA